MVRNPTGIKLRDVDRVTEYSDTYLFGAELNAWSEGLRPLGVTLPDLYRERGQLQR